MSFNQDYYEFTRRIDRLQTQINNLFDKVNRMTITEKAGLTLDYRTAAEIKIGDHDHSEYLTTDQAGDHTHNTLTLDGTGPQLTLGSTTERGQLKIFDSAGGEYGILQVAASLSINSTYTLPDLGGVIMTTAMAGNTFVGNHTFSGNLTLSGTNTLSGAHTVTGTLAVQNTLTSYGIAAAADSTYDIGASGVRYATIYGDTIDGTTLKSLTWNHDTGDSISYETVSNIWSWKIGGVTELTLNATTLDLQSNNLTTTGTLTASGYNNSNWDTAYGWGNHASAGYLTSISSENLTDLNDVVITGPGDNAILSYDLGTLTWVNISTTALKVDLSLNNVENTALSSWAGSSNITTLGTITTGVWNGSVIDGAYIGTHSHAWPTTLAALTDVNITSVGDGEVLAYYAVGSQWINRTLAEAGIAAASHSHSDPTTLTSMTNIQFTGSSDRSKIELWNTNLYAIGMTSGATYGYIGSDTSGSGTSNYVMNFQMNNDDNRGWWWGKDTDALSGGAMSLTTVGQLYLKDIINTDNVYIRNSGGSGLQIVASTGNDLIFTGSNNAHIVAAGATMYFAYSTSAWLFYITANQLLPYGDNAKNLGASGTRWANIYGVNEYFSGSVVNCSGLPTIGSVYAVWMTAGGNLIKNTSSRRYKTLITPLAVRTPPGEIGAKIDQLNPVSFQYKPEFIPEEFDEGEKEQLRTKIEIGYIAEDMVNVFPDLVGRDLEGLPDSIFYDKLVIYLVEEIKDLRKRISQLEQN